MNKPTHLDSDGKARMVNVGEKEITNRQARATVSVKLNETSFEIARENRSAKGDVITVAKLAGIQAAKKTSELIPLCHQLPLNHVEIEFEFDQSQNMIKIFSTVRCSSRTGVEMEALTACSVAALTVYDMLKAVHKDIVISDLMLLEKTGGKSGDFGRENT
ncbi:MAG: cyclic pyranopterin monophosphate synthase MoaC [candidate division Zixibacteria bacterium]